MKCKNCRYWKTRPDIWKGIPELENAPHTGNCHRYPPKRVPACLEFEPGDNLLYDDLFPFVDEDQFCGEYKDVRHGNIERHALFDIANFGRGSRPIVRRRTTNFKELTLKMIKIAEDALESS